jgi:TrmH family RNA methyltransferase
MWSNSLEDIQEDLGDICVVLDETEKPGNLGAVIRSVEAMGIKTLLLSDLQVDFFNPNVIRSSRGLLAGVNVWQGSKKEIFTLLSTQKYSLIGTSGKARQSYWDHKFKSKTALIFGSEKDGLGEFWLNKVDDLIKIPMNGNADSLNLNVSVACILAEYQRKKSDDSSKIS